MMRLLFFCLVWIAADCAHAADPTVRLTIVDDPLEFSDVRLKVEIESDSYILLHSLELALPKELARNRAFQRRGPFASEALFSAIAHTDEQRKAILARKPVSGEPQLWHRVVGPKAGFHSSTGGPSLMLGRAGPTRIKVRLLFEPIEKVDLAGAQVKGPLVTQRIRSAEAAVVLLQGGETVLLPKQKPTGSVDAEVVLDVLPRTPSFAQVGADEGRDPFWYWDGLWLFRDQGATSALSARGERFVWEHVAESFFRLSPRIPSDAISRHQPLLVQIDGDIDDFRRRFPSLSLNIKEHRPGMRFVFTHLPTDLGDRGALEFSEQLAGSSWVLDVSGGVRRFILKQPKRQLRQIKP